MEEDILFEVLAGTYEEYTVGYECVKEGKEFHLKHTIAAHSHRASVKTIAVYNGPRHDILVTGGTDETIHIYDLRSRKESGILINHSGTITCLRFTPDGSHLISASEDGSISIYKIGSWFLEKTWPKAHKGMGVLHLSIHPSGKLALSLGADKTLRTWNLVKGRPAYTINLSGKVNRPEIVEWSLCGSYYGLVNEDALNLYSLEKAGMITSLQVNARITNICFMKEGRACIADWSGALTCYLYRTSEKLWEIKEGDIRLKAVTSFKNYLISVDGQGKINIYNSESKETPKRITSYETSCRVTCIAISKLLSEEERPPKKQKVVSNSTSVKQEKSDQLHKKPQEPNNGVLCSPKSQNWNVEEVKT